jgi:PST family polysaccharide transporter
VLIELGYDFLVGCGRSGQTMVLQGLWLAGLLPALVVGGELDGIRGVAIGHAVVSAGLVLPAFGVAAVRAGVPVRTLLAALARPLAGSALLAAAVLGVQAVTEPSWEQLVLAGAAGLAVYLPVVAPLRGLVRAGWLGAQPAAQPA